MSGNNVQAPANKQFRKKLLICGCCGVYFNTWPEYVDQDQDKGYGICASCQEDAQAADAREVERGWKAIIDGKIKPETREKIIAKFGGSFEDRKTFVLYALEVGWLSWGFTGSAVKEK